MTLERITEQFLFREFPNFWDDFSYLVDEEGHVNFKNDTYAEDETMSVLQQMYINGHTHQHPGDSSIDKNGRKINHALKDLYDKYISQVQIFDE
jgi:uncharacterized protein (UPF0276 family)